MPQVLEEYLVFVAKTGNTVFPWPKVKAPLRLKLETVIEEFNKAMPEDQVGQCHLASNRVEWTF